MKNSSYLMLVNAAGQLMQQHAFDHLSDEKLSRMHSCIHQLGQSGSNHEMTTIETEFLNLCSEANLYVETTTTQSLHQWYAAMNCFGMLPMQQVDADEEVA